MLKKWLQNPVVLLVFTLLVLSFIFSLRKNLTRLTLSEHNLEILKSEVGQLETEVEQKQYQLETAQQPLAKEKIARNELLLKREGEYVIQLPDIKLESEKQPPESKPTAWQQWRQLLL